MTTLEFSAAIPSLRFLPTLQLMRLADAAQRAVVHRRQVYYGAMVHHAPVVYLLSGIALRVRGISENYPPVFQWPSGWVYTSSVFLADYEPYALIASTPIELIAIDREVLLGAARMNPDLALHLAQMCARETAQLAGWLRVLSVCSMRGRIAQLLLYFARQFGCEDFRLPASSAEMARYVGCSREVFTRSLTELSRRGLIVRSARSVKIRDTAGLHAVL